MGSHKCCCPEGEGGECDCNCFGEEHGCDGCCWSPGDVVEYDHDFSGTYSVKRTRYPFGFGSRHTCGQDQYTGGRVTVRYACVGCVDCEAVEGVAHVFALLTAGKQAVNADKIVRGKFVTSSWAYDLPPYLLMACRSEDGQKHWFRSGDGSCGASLSGLLVCVQACQSGCANIEVTSCITGLTSQNYCESGPATLPVEGPDSFTCTNCIDEIVECGGFRAYCAFRAVDTECAHSGNAYGRDSNGDCQVDCEDQLLAFHPLQECKVKLMQTLTILPPDNSERGCRWFEADDCCKSRKSEPEGGDDVEQPDALTTPTIADYGFPTGWIGECDCYTSINNPQNDGCETPACPANATDVVQALTCL